MSVANQSIKNHSRREELIEKGKAARFFGAQVRNLTKDDLFMMIGLLGMNSVRDEEIRRKDRAFVKSFDKLRYL